MASERELISDANDRAQLERGRDVESNKPMVERREHDHELEQDIIDLLRLSKDFTFSDHEKAEILRAFVIITPSLSNGEEFKRQLMEVKKNVVERTVNPRLEQFRVRYEQLVEKYRTEANKLAILNKAVEDSNVRLSRYVNSVCDELLLKVLEEVMKKR